MISDLSKHSDSTSGREGMALNGGVPSEGYPEDDNAASELSDLLRIAILRGVLDSVTSIIDKAVFVTDENGAVVFLNQTAETLTSSARVPAMNKHIGQLLFTPLDSSLRRYSDLLNSALADGAVASRSAIPVTTHDGDIKYINFDVFPLTDLDVGLFGGIVIASNYSDSAQVAAVVA